MLQIKRWWLSALIGIVILGAGFFIGQYWHPGFFINEWYPGYIISKLLTGQPSNNCLQLYPLTDQSLDCMSYDDSASRLKAVDESIDAAVAEYIKEGKATNISIWVRDLVASQTASTNEDVRYAPASLLKLPLMIAYYKLSELEPSVLNDKIAYQASLEANDAMQNYVSSTTLEVGQSYTVEQLIEAAIINSDNGAADTLTAHLDPAIFTQTLLDLGIKIPSSDNSTTHDFMTVKTYAAIFRTLYTASYLSRADSQKALALMSESAFKGISEPLPPSVTVADKFGEREVDNADGSVQVRELHDCGIVYKGSKPYIICIMTQGNDFSQLLTIIQDLSAVVYQKI